MTVACDFIELAAPGVQTLTAYQPGKPESELRREYGLDHIIKLASNENPLGPSPQAIAAVQAELKALARYPDGNGFDLKQTLAAHHQLPAECITLGNGSNDVLELLARAFVVPQNNVIFSEHAFAVYALVTQAIGAQAHVAKAYLDDHAMPHGHDLTALGELITSQTRLIFIANPNNPTGTWLAATELQAFLDHVPAQVLVTIDEAYFEYVEDSAYASAVAWLDRYPNLIVMRTFSKAYGLAGLRIGYALSHPEVADVLNRVRQPFNVNSLALVGAQAALTDRDYLEHSRTVNRSGMGQLQAGLSDLGLRCLPSVANFLCVKIPRPGQDVFQELLPKGIIVRPIGGYGLSHFIRVTIGTEAENQAFLNALRTVL